MFVRTAVQGYLGHYSFVIHMITFSFHVQCFSVFSNSR